MKQEKKYNECVGAARRGEAKERRDRMGRDRDGGPGIRRDGGG